MPKRTSKYDFERLGHVGAEVLVPFARTEDRHPNHLRGCAYSFARARGWKVSVKRSEDRGGHIVRRVA